MAKPSKGKSKAPAALPRKGVNLFAIFDELNERYFGGMLCCGIGWRHLSLQSENVELGICVTTERFIKINVILDDVSVPDWYLRFIVYHEMLHLFYPPNMDGYDDPHNPRFLALEKRYPDYNKCIEYGEGDLYTLVIDKWRKHKNGKRRKQS